MDLPRSPAAATGTLKIIYYNWGWTGKKPPRDPESMAGGTCISYTGSDPWNKNLNLDGKK
jgi:hypothetical protein